MELHDIPSLLWSCHPRTDRPRRDRPTDKRRTEEGRPRPSPERRRRRRRRRTDRKAAGCTGAGSSCREGGGTVRFTKLQLRSVRSFVSAKGAASVVRKVRFVRIRLPFSSSSQVDDKNAGRTARTDIGATLFLSLSFFRRHNFNFSKLRLPPPPRASGSKLSLHRTRPVGLLCRRVQFAVLMPLGSVADCCYSRPACLPVSIALRRWLCFS